MRLAVADAMRRSWTRPLATVGRPVRLDRVLDHRGKQDPKPGLTLYVLRAFALALAEDPASAGFLIGERIVHPRAFDIGVAVQVEDGVVVPVLRNVDTMTLSQLTNEYSAMVDRARRRRLTSDDTQGGIATVTNFGTFGLTSGTPIPLPNETLILGLAAGVTRPTWSEQVEAFVPIIEADLVVERELRDVGSAGASNGQAGSGLADREAVLSEQHDEFVALRGFDEHAVVRGVDNFLHWGRRQQAAGANHDEIVGEQGEFGDEVAGDEYRPARFGVATKEASQPADAIGVESVGGLVEQQRLGFTEQCTGEGEPLSHAEGEAPDSLVRHAADADLIENGVDPQRRQPAGGAHGAEVVTSRSTGMGRRIKRCANGGGRLR